MWANCPSRPAHISMKMVSSPLLPCLSGTLSLALAVSEVKQPTFKLGARRHVQEL